MFDKIISKFDKISTNGYKIIINLSARFVIIVVGCAL